MSEWVIASYQKEKALPLQSPWQAANKDCFIGIVCVENDAEE